jgi:fatty-acyl-CoA synthase
VAFTITSAFRWWVWEHPGRLALDYDGEEITYAALFDWAFRIAAHLREAGVRPGDRVSAYAANSVEYAVLLLGNMLCGGISAPVSFRSSVRELQQALGVLEPVLLFTDEERASTARDAVCQASVPALRSLKDIRTLRAAPAGTFEVHDPRSDEPLFIIGTSGSTGTPKGVIYSHGSTMTYAAEFAIMEPRCGNGGSVLVTGPFSSASGTLLLMQFLATGATIYAQSRFTPERSLQLLHEKKITTFLASVIFFERIAALPEFEHADLSSIAFAQISGARVNPELLARYRERGVILRQAYGCTEAGGAWAARGDIAVMQPEKCGPGAMFSQFAIQAEDGSRAPPGTPGEILVRSAGLAVGYWNNEAATRSAFQEGWLHTGDLGVMDEGGNLTFIDRLKDIIISGGLNISAMEVEAVIAEVPGVTEVVVIPAQDPQFGETPMAVVYGDPDRFTIPAIIAHCNQHLSNYKVPRYIVIETEPLPRLASGKIAKRLVREKYRDAAATLPRVR